jgi:hypothetical protein
LQRSFVVVCRPTVLLPRIFTISLFSINAGFTPFGIQWNEAGEIRLLERTKRMSIQEVSAERFAQLFHHYHQALADDSGSSSTPRAKDAWESVPAPEKGRLIAAARLALLEVELAPSERQDRKYFAKPGEAEWGC